jgi:hypothetical protein
LIAGGDVENADGNAVDCWKASGTEKRLKNCMRFSKIQSKYRLKFAISITQNPSQHIKNSLSSGETFSSPSFSSQ